MKDKGIHLGGTARSPDDVITLHRLGLAFAEIGVPDPERFAPLVPRYREVNRELGLYFLAHGPREGNPNDIPGLENRYLPKILHLLELVQALNIPLLTIHLWMDPRFVRPKTIAYKMDFLKRVIQRAAEKGITVCLENLSENAIHLGPVFRALPDLYLTLDLGHAQLLTEENTSFGFFDQHRDRIRHIHLHDNRGGNSPEDDLHLPVGEGDIDFEKIFAKMMAADYSGTITLELKPGEIEGCLGYVKRLLGPLLKREASPA